MEKSIRRPAAKCGSAGPKEKNVGEEIMQSRKEYNHLTSNIFPIMNLPQVFHNRHRGCGVGLWYSSDSPFSTGANPTGCGYCLLSLKTFFFIVQARMTLSLNSEFLSNLEHLQYNLTCALI